MIKTSRIKAKAVSSCLAIIIIIIAIIHRYGMEQNLIPYHILYHTIPLTSAINVITVCTSHNSV